ncbi:MAG: LCP family protein [Chloroflexia bacterium]
MTQTSNNQSPSSPPNGKATRPNHRPTPQPGYSPPPTYRARPPSPTYRANPGSGPQHAQHIDPQTALLRARYRTQARRTRMRLVVFTVVAIMSVSGIGIYAYLSNTVTVLTDALTKIFKPPVETHVDANGTPVPVVYPDWGTEPVNILLLGLDYRPGDEDTRADTQIVVHVDPVSKSAAMVALPRDMWVPIPGFGEGRINAAYQLGESNRETIEGGGPVLAMSTIEQNLGIHIHYYAKVDFTGFEQIIDTMEGLTIDVPRPLVDNEYPLGDYGVTRLYVPAGLQHMDGRTALAYARSRHADSDLGRNSRQQQVLLAIREQGLNLNLITKLNELAGELSDAVETNLTVSQVGSLAQLGKEFDQNSIQTVTITADMVTETILDNGADVLIPNWDVIRPLVSQAFADPRLAKEAARISVQNGTETGGIGKKVYDQLVAEGFFVPDLRSVPGEAQGTHPVTTITDYTGGQKPRTLEALCNTLEIDCSQVKQGDPTTAPVAQTDGLPVDIMVIAGDDKIQ